MADISPTGPAPMITTSKASVSDASVESLSDIDAGPLVLVLPVSVWSSAQAHRNEKRSTGKLSIVGNSCPFLVELHHALAWQDPMQRMDASPEGREDPGLHRITVERPLRPQVRHPSCAPGRIKLQ